MVHRTMGLPHKSEPKNSYCVIWVKDNAYQALQVAERQEFKTSEIGGVMDALDSLIGQLNIFSLFNSPHYDATLAEYIQALKARKLAAKSKIRIRRVLH